VSTPVFKKYKSFFCSLGNKKRRCSKARKPKHINGFDVLQIHTAVERSMAIKMLFSLVRKILVKFFAAKASIAIEL